MPADVKTQTADSAAELKTREAGLLETAKALRALYIYPARHPARAQACGQGFAGLQSILAIFGELSYQVGANGFVYNEQRIGDSQPMVRELAREMHLRQIKSFSLRPELTLRDFLSLLELIIEDPEKFRQGKYIEQWIRERQMETVWINEIDFSHLSSLSAPEEEEEKEKPPEQAPQEQLLDILELLDRETDAESFGQLLRQGEALARIFLEDGQYEIVWRLLVAVSLQAGEEWRPGPANEQIRALALRSVQGLAAGEFLQRLLTRYVDQRETERESLARVFGLLGEQLVDTVIDTISRTEAVGPYRPLLELALSFGPPARPRIEARLRDENSIAVRRALFLLGELRQRESVETVKPLLRHREAKVRKEAARTLARIRGVEATRVLTGFLQQGEDSETEIMVVQALAEGKDLAAVPALVSLLRKNPLNEDTVALFESAVEALGRIGSREAIPDLVHVLNSWKLLNRELGLRVRVKAAEALGRLGGESAMQALARYAGKKDDPLTRACTQSLETLLDGGDREGK